MPLFRDSDVQALERSSLRELRNTVVFHFDISAMEEAAKRIKGGGSPFLTMGGEARMHSYFIGADEAAIELAVPQGDMTREEWLAEVKVWLGRAADVSLRIANAVDSVAVQILKSYGISGTWR